MTSLPADTSQPLYLARLGTWILHSPPSVLSLIFDLAWPISSLQFNPEATPPSFLTQSMCHCLVAIINSPRNEFSPDTIPFALCILLRYRMTAGDAELDACEPAHIIMAAVLLAQAWLSDYGTNVLKFAHMAGVLSDRMCSLKLKLLQALGYRLWIRDEEFARHTAKLNELCAYAYRPPVAQLGFSPYQYQYFEDVVG